jgi:peptide/nickel transport system substrate-binding protein
MKSKLLVLVSVIVLASMLLAACQPKATETPVVTEPPVVVTEEPTAVGPHIMWPINLRQAIAATIDREAIVDRVFEGRNIPAYSPIPIGFASLKESFLDKYGTRDIQMAKDLLTEAGYTEDNKFVFDVWYPPDHYGVETVDVMQVVKEQVEETGLATVNFQTQNWAEYVDSFVAGQLPFFILGWFPDFVDEETWTSPWADCEQSKGNGVFYCNDQFQALLEAAREETDTAQRNDLYGQIQDMFAEEVPIIPLFWEPEFITWRNGVEGVTIGAPFEFNYDVLKFADGYTPAAGSTDTIIIGTTDEVNSLDPQDSYSTHDWEILKNTGRALLGYEPGTATLVPGSAGLDFEVSDDGLTYTFHLLPNIKFADGTPFVASAFVEMFDRWNLGGQVGFLPLTYVESVEAPDDTTVVYHLTGAYGFFPAIVATPPFIPRTFEIPLDTILQIPTKIVGMGPYQMVSYDPGQQMVLEVNPNYYGTAPLIKKVIIKYFADPTTMASAVESGQIDIAWRILGPVEATRLSTVAGLTVMTVKAPALRYLVFNVTFMTGGE